MDQVKIGKQIASLRRQAGLTQEQLGEKLGVTNKTVSRWENGNYMPDIEMLVPLAKEFHVSVDALLAGEETTVENSLVGNPPQESDENPIAAGAASAFSLRERRIYFKQKWRKEHISLLLVLGLILAAALIIPFAIGKPWLVGLSPILVVVGHCYQYNKMMIYVDAQLYH